MPLGSLAGSYEDGERRAAEILAGSSQPPVPDVVREYKWCRRTNECETPLIYQRAQKPRLVWRREFGRECNICPYVVSGDKELSAKKNTLEQDMKDEGPLYQDFMEKVRLWESRKNESNGGHVPSNRIPAARTSAGASVSSGMQTRERIGYLWPLKIWEVEFPGKTPGKRDITTIVHCSRKVRGVMMDKDIKGAIEVFNVGESKVERAVTLAASHDGNTSEQIENSYQSAAKRIRLSAADGATGDGALQIKSNSSSSKAKDDEDDDALLDDLWGRSLAKAGRAKGAAASVGGTTTCDEGNDPEEEVIGRRSKGSGNDTRRRAEDQESPGPKQPKAKAPRTPLKDEMTVTPQKPKGGGNRARELDWAEQIALKGEQLVASVSNDEGLVAATVQGIKSIAEKVEATLTPDLMNIYSKDMELEDGKESRGIKVLERLRALNGL